MKKILVLLTILFLSLSAHASIPIEVLKIYDGVQLKLKSIAAISFQSACKE